MIYLFPKAVLTSYYDANQKKKKKKTKRENMVECIQKHLMFIFAKSSSLHNPMCFTKNYHSEDTVTTCTNKFVNAKIYMYIHFYTAVTSGNISQTDSPFVTKCHQSIVSSSVSYKAQHLGHPNMVKQILSLKFHHLLDLIAYNISC